MEAGMYKIISAKDGSQPKLAMQRLWLTGQILPVGARLLIRHEFCNGADTNLEVVYSFMLPRDAALRRFDVYGDNFTAHSELRKVQDAVKQYEEGIEGGHLSTLAREYKDGVVNLSLGNLRRNEALTINLEIVAGVELHDNGFRFRFPFTLAPGYHSKMQMIDINGIGEMELPADEFGDVILPRIKREPDGLHEIGFDISVKGSNGISEIASPSHAIRVREENGEKRISSSKASDAPNRDLVLDIGFDAKQTHIISDNKRFAMIVPSTIFGNGKSSPRKVAIVIDRSGSMQGNPMIQAKRAVTACLSALSQDDRFTLIAFDNEVEQMDRSLQHPNMHSREKAKRFLHSVDARGGTELAKGFTAAAKLVAGGGDVLVITDGQVFGSEEILAQARKLNVRIHTLGIGSASQDRFLSLLASSTGGICRFVTAQERVDMAALDLFASIGRPVADDIGVINSQHDIQPVKTAFAGSPWVYFGHTENKEITVKWKNGKFTIAKPSPENNLKDTIFLLEGAKRITHMESMITALYEAEYMPVLAQLSGEYGLASRAMSLVSVVEREGDIAGELPSIFVVPVGMAEDTSYGSYAQSISGMQMLAAAPAPAGLRMQKSGNIPTFLRRRTRSLNESDSTRVFDSSFSAPELEAEKQDTEDNETQSLFDLAAKIEPDGGMPGSNINDRALNTLCALFTFMFHGHTENSGAFRAHVARMIEYLGKVKGLNKQNEKVLGKALAYIGSGNKSYSNKLTSWNDIDGYINSSINQ